MSFDCGKGHVIMLCSNVILPPRALCSDEGFTLETSALYSLQWPSYIINSVDKTKLSCNIHTDVAQKFI